MAIAERLGARTFYDYMLRFAFDKKTGVDLPGEAVGIMHKLENIGPVELATMSFGQSFQITPMQLMRAAAAAVNGGFLVTPHVGMAVISTDGISEDIRYEKGEKILTDEVSALMREILESVVESGTGNRTYIPGYRVGGKTATSEKLPRRMGKYIASFLAFAPADDPRVMALVLIDEPQGAYYGGQVAGPAMKELLENILPYLGVEPVYSEAELKAGEGKVSIPDLTGQSMSAAIMTLRTLGLTAEIRGSVEKNAAVVSQFPKAGDEVNRGALIILNME